VQEGDRVEVDAQAGRVTRAYRGPVSFRHGSRRTCEKRKRGKCANEKLKNRREGAARIFKDFSPQ